MPSATPFDPLTRDAACGRWARIVAKSSLTRTIDACLRGASQVVFQDHVPCAVLILLAVAWAAYEQKNPALLISAVLATIVATLTARLLGADSALLRRGLFGFNGILVGIAMPTFLAPTPGMWVCTVLAAAASTLAMLALAALLRPWKLQAMTAPFVLATWCTLLAARQFAQLPSTGLPPPIIGHVIGAAPVLIAIPLAMLRGIAQVFLLPSATSGAPILIGIAASSRAAALFAAAGSLLALAVAWLLGAELAAISAGLYSFSAVLTAIALGSVFSAAPGRPGLRDAIYAAFGVVATVFVHTALSTLLEPLGIPALTMPFVLTTWIFLLVRRLTRF